MKVIQLHTEIHLIRSWPHFSSRAVTQVHTSVNFQIKNVLLWTTDPPNFIEISGQVTEILNFENIKKNLIILKSNFGLIQGLFFRK